MYVRNSLEMDSGRCYCLFAIAVVIARVYIYIFISIILLTRLCICFACEHASIHTFYRVHTYKLWFFMVLFRSKKLRQIRIFQFILRFIKNNGPNDFFATQKWNIFSCRLFHFVFPTRNHTLLFIFVKITKFDVPPFAFSLLVREMSREREKTQSLILLQSLLFSSIFICFACLLFLCMPCAPLVAFSISIFFPTRLGWDASICFCIFSLCFPFNTATSCYYFFFGSSLIEI